LQPLPEISNGFYILWVLINRLFRYLENVPDRLRSSYNHTLQIGSKEVLRPEQVTQFLSRTIAFARLVSLGAVSVLYINVILSFFSQTQSIANSIFQSVLDSIIRIIWGFINYVPNLIFLVVLGFVCYHALRFIRFVFKEVEAGNLTLPNFDREWAIPTLQICRILLVTLFAVIAFPYLPGSQSSAFQGITIFLGVLFSLGSSSAVGNIIAGVLLTYTRAFQIHDTIQIGELEGTVVEKGLFVTRLLNGANQFVSIPNSTILNSIVLNYRVNSETTLKDSNYPPAKWIVSIDLPIKVPHQQVREIIMNATREIPNIVQEPEPLLLNSAFNKDYITYQIKFAFHQPTIVAETASELIGKIQNGLEAHGISRS
jgi:small-conductance mechanosensitive channel